MKATNFMMLGGLMLATCVEHCGLHRRIALRIVLLMGTSAKMAMFGFMATDDFEKEEKWNLWNPHRAVLLEFDSTPPNHGLGFAIAVQARRIRTCVLLDRLSGVGWVSSGRCTGTFGRGDVGNNVRICSASFLILFLVQVLMARFLIHHFSNSDPSTEFSDSANGTL